MGMIIDGQWVAETDRFMKDGVFRREASVLPDRLEDPVLDALTATPERFVLVASNSCPWSHGAILARVLKGFADRLPLHLAGGARVEGYALTPKGPLSGRFDAPHIHQLYSISDPGYTGRATVPLLWDTRDDRVVSNASGDIMRAFDSAGEGPTLCPADLRHDIDALIAEIFDALSNAVYRAGLAQRQEPYEEAVDSVFAMLDRLEARLDGQRYLFGTALTLADLRLFATLVRFDTVYYTHFRCCRARVVDYPALWRFTRDIYHLPGVRQTVDFDEIRAGYYLNDGDHNPHGIVGVQPALNWVKPEGGW